MTKNIFLIFISLLLSLNTFSQEKDLKIIRVTPEGENVVSERQVIFEFNRPVVPLGKMQRTKEEIPISISPNIDCQWRWLNTSTLTCNLNEKDQLKKSTKYEIKVDPKITAEDGTSLSGDLNFNFTTEYADVRYTWLKAWQSPALPTIRVTFNQSVSSTSVIDNLFFTQKNDQGEDQKIKITIEPDPDDSEKADLIFINSNKEILYLNREQKKSDEQLKTVNNIEARRIWLIKPIQELNHNSEITLNLTAGLVSAEGNQISTINREVLKFDTFPEFNFAGVKCTTNLNEEIFINNQTNQDKKCDPLSPISLAFTSPVLRSQVKNNFKFTPNLFGNKKDYDPWGTLDDEYSYSLKRAYNKGEYYYVYLPAGLQAAQTYEIELPKKELFGTEKYVTLAYSFFKKQALTNLADEFGRKLFEPFKLKFSTDHRKPNFEIVHHNAVLEKNTDSEVPLYVNNLQETTFSYKKITSNQRVSELVDVKNLPLVKDLQYAIPFSIRNILDGKSGAVYGHLSTNPQVEKYHPSEYRLFAQVTPYQLHLKLGHFSSLIWLSDLATGKPVENAKISVYSDSLANLSEVTNNLATATTNNLGIAFLPGTDQLDPNLKLSPRWESGNDPDNNTRLFIRVDKDQDFALLPVSRDFLIDTWQVSEDYLSTNNQVKFGHIKTWGTTAQGIYRAGDTVQYKIYVRDQNDQTLIAAPKEKYTLEILDPTNKVIHSVKDLKLSEYGSFSGEFNTAKQSITGWYRFRLTSDFANLSSENSYDYYEEDQNSGVQGKQTWFPLRVLISDFTPAPFKVVNEINGDIFHSGKEIEVFTSAKLHSGGAYTNTTARTTIVLNSSKFNSKHPLASSFNFNNDYENTETKQLFQKIDDLDPKGEIKHTYKIEEQNIIYGKLLIESSVRDDQGRFISNQKNAEYLGVDRLLGLKSTKWIYEANQPAIIEQIVVDQKGTPTADTEIETSIKKKITTSTKVKGAGNAYLNNYNTEWIEVGKCKIKSLSESVKCEFIPKEAGSYLVEAVIRDTRGNPHSNKMQIWVTGKDYVLWDEKNEFFLQIIPDKTEYRVGETAKYLIKNPFPGAQALITIERFGIIDHFVKTLDSSTSTFELEIKPDYLPGFYLSVLVSSPRVSSPKNLGELDLGKPAIRMGYLTVPVKDPYKEIIVNLTTDKEVYKPRDKVKLKLNAKSKFPNTEKIELAIAVIDESVFDLLLDGKNYYDPYQGFYKLDSLDLRNYNLLTRLVGIQKFEKKGANPGGDGGIDSGMRNVFKFVSYWNPSIELNQNENTEVEFEVPDNLTAWKILALASTAKDHLGLGEQNFKVNRPTEIRPVMPNQISEGDQFEAGFSIMNRSDQAREVNVLIKTTGDISSIKDYEQKLNLAPYQREVVSFPVQSNILPSNKDYSKGNIKFLAKAGDLIDQDLFEHNLTINKQRIIETAANYGASTEKLVEQSVSFPKDIYSDVGNVSVVLTPSVIGNIDGAFKYMKNYPYLCWEQILSKAVMAAYFQNLKPYFQENLDWEESLKLPENALKIANSFQAPNGGMAYYKSEDQYVDPYLSAYTAIAFNWLRELNFKIPNEVEDKLHNYLIDYLKRDVSPSFYTEGMSSSIRAASLAALAPHKKIDLNDLNRFLPHINKMSLLGKSFYVQAATNLSDSNNLIEQTLKLILSHANETAGKFIFNEELDDSYTRILSSPLRENCLILDTLLKITKYKSEIILPKDISSKLVRTLNQTRANRDHWENTQENIFCMNALINYSKTYENIQPNLNLEVKLNETSFGKAKFTNLKDPGAILEKNITEQDPGQSKKIQITKSGEGIFYYSTRLNYSTKLSNIESTNSGIEIHREYSVQKNDQWVQINSLSNLNKGDLVRTDLFLSLPSARNFVVVHDPVPGGLEVINQDLANSSTIDYSKGNFVAAGESWWFKFNDWITYNTSRWSFYHKEVNHDSVNFYSDYLPAGNYHLSYTAYAIANGKYTATPAKAEEMYDPDVFGKTSSQNIQIGSLQTSK